eukprot:GHVS01035399.1.p1 GENE.GHVS01035399.1~~GHVS01035399.1.p1  ORF type:complete len:319 (+),score=92.76 GHVS01035399.1:503-1459(+)
MRFILPPSSSSSSSCSPLFSISNVVLSISAEQTHQEDIANRIISCLGLNCPPPLTPTTTPTTSSSSCSPTSSSPTSSSPTSSSPTSSSPTSSSPTSSRKRLGKFPSQSNQLPSQFFYQTGQLVVASLASQQLTCKLQLARDTQRCRRDSTIWRKYVRPIGWSTLGGDQNVGEMLETIALNIGANSDPILGYGRNRHECVEWHGQFDLSGYAIMPTRFASCFHPCLFYTRVVMILLIMYCPEPDIYTYVGRGPQVQMVCNNKSCINYWHIVDLNATTATTSDDDEKKEEEEGCEKHDLLLLLHADTSKSLRCHTKQHMQ